MEPLSDIQGYASLLRGNAAQAEAQALQASDSPNIERAREAAQAFESYFVEAMLREMRRTVPLSEGSQGQAMEIFQGMFDGAISEKIAKGPGIGLADMIESSMLRALPEVMGVPVQGSPEFTDLLDMGRVSSAFGMRRDPITGAMKKHEGIDIAIEAGTPVRPVRPGKVVFSGTKGGYGQVVVVDHGRGLQSTYAHLRDRRVQVGDAVDLDKVLGHVGSTGRSTGPHLHLEVSEHGQLVDPEQFLER